MSSDTQTATKKAQDASELVPENVYVFPVTFAQQRLWFLDQLQPDATSYSVPWSIHMRGQLNAEALERSLNEIVRRHEVLRTIFPTRNGEPAPVVLSATEVDLVLIGTEGEKAIDVFHITAKGAKLTDTEQMELTADLTRMLEGNDEVDQGHRATQ